MKQLGILLLFLTFAAGCEKDVREPGEPRVLTPLISPQAIAPQTSAATRSSAPARGFAYCSPNKWT